MTGLEKRWKGKVRKWVATGNFIVVWNVNLERSPQIQENAVHTRRIFLGVYVKLIGVGFADMVSSWTQKCREYLAKKFSWIVSLSRRTFWAGII